MRLSATIRPRPTTTSEAATAITVEREDLPVAVVEVAREGDQREVRAVEHDLEREQDDQRVAPEQHAECADAEQEAGDAEVPGDVRAFTAARHLLGIRAGVRAEDDAADRGDEQDDRRDLEREQVVGEEEAADVARAAEVAADVVGVREAPPAFSPITTTISTRSAAAASTAPIACQLGPPVQGDSVRGPT